MDVPASPQFIQLEETDERFPTSESMLQKIGGSLNYIIDALQQSAVGEIEASMLTLVQFQALRGSGWVLADGGSAAGSRYETITGNSTVPDCRGLFMRSQQGARTDGNGNPDGNLAVGTYTADSLASHKHTATPSTNACTSNLSNVTDNGGIITAPERLHNNFTGATVTFNADGVNDTAPVNGTINYFIRIN